MDDVDKKVGAVDTKVDAVETKVDDVDKKVGAVDTKVVTVETKVDAVDKKVGAVDTKVDDVKTEMDKVLKTLETSKTEGTLIQSVHGILFVTYCRQESIIVLTVYTHSSYVHYHHKCYVICSVVKIQLIKVSC